MLLLIYISIRSSTLLVFSAWAVIMLLPPSVVPLLGEQATDDDSVVSTTTVLVGFEHIVPLLGEDCFPAFGVDTRHDLFALFCVECGEGILDESALFPLFDTGEIDVRRHLEFTGLTTLETPGSDHCAHFDVSGHCHPPFLES